MIDFLLLSAKAILIVMMTPLLVYVLAKMWTYGSIRAKREMEDNNGKGS